MTNNEPHDTVENALLGVISEHPSIHDFKALREAVAVQLHPPTTAPTNRDWVGAFSHDQPALTKDEEGLFTAAVNRLVAGGRIVPAFTSPLPDGMQISIRPSSQ